MSSPDPDQYLAYQLDAQRWLAAVTLASSLISAAGRPHSVDEAFTLASDCYRKMFPAQSEKQRQWEQSRLSARTHK